MVNKKWAPFSSKEKCKKQNTHQNFKVFQFDHIQFTVTEEKRQIFTFKRLGTDFYLALVNPLVNQNIVWKLYKLMVIRNVKHLLLLFDIHDRKWGVSEVLGQRKQYKDITLFPQIFWLTFLVQFSFVFYRLND